MWVDPAAIVASHGLPSGRPEVQVDRPGRLVAKVGRHAVKIDARPAAFGPERESITRLAAIGLPVPRVVAWCDAAPSHLVLTWIDGEPLSAASPAAAQRQAGRLLRHIHAQPAHRDDTIADWIVGWTDEILAWWTTFAGPSPQRCDEIRDWCRRLQPFMGSHGRLTLFDGRPEHFIVRWGDIAGLIDLHDVSAGDPAMDLAVLAVDDEALLPAVLDGYRPTADENAVFTRLIPFYVLLRRLASADWEHRFGDASRTPVLLDLVDRTAIPE